MFGYDVHCRGPAAPSVIYLMIVITWVQRTRTRQPLLENNKPCNVNIVALPNHRRRNWPTDMSAVHEHLNNMCTLSATFVVCLLLFCQQSGTCSTTLQIGSQDLCILALWKCLPMLAHGLRKTFEK